MEAERDAPHDDSSFVYFFDDKDAAFVDIRSLPDHVRKVFVVFRGSAIPCVF
jgi:hypothetical protein